jgi:endonuclease/exonuclease/phosphatase family metal-dependent hydrolase
MRYCAILVCLFATVPSVAADEKPDRITIATWNMEWFFDAFHANNLTDLAKAQSAPNDNEWQWKLNGVTNIVAQMKPTILALQEVENRTVVYELTKKLESQHGLRYRIAFVEGWDNYTDQDVAIIYQGGLVEFSYKEQTGAMFQSEKFYNVNKHIFARFEWGQPDDLESLTLVNVHLRATPEKADLRQRQCRLIHHWIQDDLEQGNNVIVLGDLNTEELAGASAAGSDIAILQGKETPSTSDDLSDLHEHLNEDARNTHLIGRQFDRILVSASLLEDAPQRRDLAFSQIKTRKDLVVVGQQDADHFNIFYQIAQTERDISDHYPVVAEFVFN